MNYHRYKVNHQLEIAYVGPHIDEGPLPAVFYFALSKEESLLQNPFNEPVLRLSRYALRIFSIDLPFHGENLPATRAIAAWAAEVAKNHDIIATFAEQFHIALEKLLADQAVEESRLGLMGLSRGGFIACHIAARHPKLSTILAFAPLTTLTFAKEFADLQTHPLALQLNLNQLYEYLYNRHIRFYIANRDTRVNTELCTQWVLHLAEVAFQHKIRSPNIELIVSPPIGHMGHGTSNPIFQAGADWIAKQVGAINLE